MDLKGLKEMINDEVSSFLAEAPAKPGIAIPGRSDKYLVTIKNDAEGVKKLEALKVALGHEFSFRVRGRHSDRKEVLGTEWRKGTQNEIPATKAEYWAVYASRKTPGTKDISNEQPIQ